MTEPCTQKETIGVLKAYQKDIRNDVKDIKTAILGDGKSEGLATQVTVHRKYFNLIAAIGGPVLVALTVKALWDWIGN